MRLTLHWHGWDVIDVEARLWRKRPSDDQADDGPTLRASGGGQAERSEVYGDPATVAGFGFRLPRTAPDAATSRDRETDRKAEG